MPLSEHEQRVLAELEESLVRHDPQFANRVRTETVYRHSGRQLKWSALCFVVGLAVLVAFYSESIVVGLLGVAVMFAAGIVFERNLRRLGRAGWHDFTHPRVEGEQPGVEHAVQGTRDWLRSHFRRDH